LKQEDIKVETANDVSDFERICGALTNRIVALGEINLDTLGEELRKLSSPLSDSPDPGILARDLSRIQAYKDRAVEIVRILTKVYLTHKRVVEILTKGWPKHSIEKSAEKREGEALLKFSNFIMAASDVESAYRHALGVMKNLESQQESVSRQISCAMVSSNIMTGRYARSDDNSNKADNITDWDKFNDTPDKLDDGSNEDNLR
jgi:hypothetical protein